MEKDKGKFFKKLMIFKETKSIIIELIILLIIGGIILFINNKSGKKTIITKSELVSVAKKNNLNTAEYIYNGIAVMQNDKKEDVYYVNYKGTVVAGIDLDNMEIKQDNKNKKVIVKIPKISITENKVDNKTLDIIFLDEKYRTETVHAEAYKISKKDLAAKAKDNENFIDKAQEKADSIIRALIKPLIDAEGNGYELIIERGA